MKPYTLADIKALQERQQTAHRGRSIYSDMRSISEDAFRNALENDALPIIAQLLEVIEKQHHELKELLQVFDSPDDKEARRHITSAMDLAEPFIEKDKHQQRLRREEDEQRSR
jgi:hypothetical protein